MSCPIKVNSSTIELTVHTSCYYIKDLLCVAIKNSDLTGLFEFFIWKNVLLFDLSL